MIAAVLQRDVWQRRANSLQGRLLQVGANGPAVNFAISQRGAAPRIDHIGIQVETDAELAEMNA